MKIDKESMKMRNRNLVLNLLRKEGAHSRTDISKKTGLGLSTVTNIFDELISNNWIHEVGARNINTQNVLFFPLTIYYPPIPSKNIFIGISAAP